MSAGDLGLHNRCQKRSVEYRVDTPEIIGEPEFVGGRRNDFYDFEWSKLALGELSGRSGCLDVFGGQPNFVSDGIRRRFLAFGVGIDFVAGQCLSDG